MDDRTISDAAQPSTEGGSGPRPQQLQVGPENLYLATISDGGAGSTVSGEQAERCRATGDKYRVVHLIGKGGMGTVSLAQDVRLNRWVALKRLSEQFAEDTRLLQRFHTEAKSVGSLTHFHIVQVYAMDEDAEGPYIAMEYVAGPESGGRADWPPEAPNPPLDLEELVKTKGAMDLAKTVALGIKLAGAVKYAHKRGVIHRDIKPANILFNEDWEPKLADFGLARQVNLQQEGATLAGAQLLTLGYGAPEQEVDASKVDERADIYGMGGTLWFALSGQNPRFFRESEVPELLRPVLAKALHKDREKRFQTAADFEQTLSQLDSRLKQAPVAEAPAEDKKDDGFRTFADRVATLRSESRYPEAINSLRAMTLSVDPKQRKLVQWAEKELPVVQQEYAAAQKKRDDAVRQATQWIAAARCAEAVNLLNGIPLAFHNPELVDVLERAKTVLGQAKSPAKSMDDIVSMLGGEVLAEPARPIASMSGHRRSEETRKLLVTIIAAAATVAGLLLMALLVRASLSGNGSPPQVASDESKSAGAAEGGNKSRSEEAGAASTDLENKSQERNPQESSAASDSREAGMDSKSPAVLPPSPSGAGSEPSVGKPSAADRQAGMLSEPATKAPSPPFASKAADRPAAPNLPADASADDSSAERPPATANMRIWRDASGEHETEAELIEVQEGQVRLRRPDGSVVTVPLEKMSEADQEFIRAQTKSNEKASPKPEAIVDREAIASRKLKTAKRHNVHTARSLLREIVAEYPDTKAGREAKTILERLPTRAEKR